MGRRASQGSSKGRRTSWEGKEEKRRESKREVRGITRFGLRGKGERETLRVRSREITLVVCGFSYVQEVTMVNSSDLCTWQAESLLAGLSWIPLEKREEEDEKKKRLLFPPRASCCPFIRHFFSFPRLHSHLFSAAFVSFLRSASFAVVRRPMRVGFVLSTFSRLRRKLD